MELKKNMILGEKWRKNNLNSQNTAMMDGNPSTDISLPKTRLEMKWFVSFIVFYDR